jgi:hypothetical protein
MKNRLNRAIAALATLVALATCIAPFPVSAQWNHYSLTVTNASSYGINRIYLSPSDDNNWGPDQLGRNVIGAGRTFTLTGIRPGEYDVRFVDEDGDSCILKNQNMFTNISWRLTNTWLLNCEFR